ncbi:MAG: hypothetical protein E7426_04680 [Ruminococcaceae bacterium]|nr:hypothetical protein [Oscillospiraceae bacterium]
MTDYADILKIGLTDVGMRQELVKQAMELYCTDQDDDLVRFLKRQRCELVDEMHESQRKVDRLDYLIRQAQTKQN